MRYVEDEEKLISGGSDRCSIVWDYRSSAYVTKCHHESSVWAIGVEDGFVYTGERRGVINKHVSIDAFKEMTEVYEGEAVHDFTFFDDCLIVAGKHIEIRVEDDVEPIFIESVWCGIICLL